MPTPTDITLYFLRPSRAIRIAWALAELDLEYTLEIEDGDQYGLPSPEFRARIPHKLGKSPTITDGDVVITESGAILEHLVENHDPSSRLLPKDPSIRDEVRAWVHAAEGSFALHAMAIVYARWFVPDQGKDLLPEIEHQMGDNVRRDMEWLEATLARQHERAKDWIVGDRLTIADIQLQFTVQFIFQFKLGVDLDANPDLYPHTQAWQAKAKDTESYKRAVAKTGFVFRSSLDPA